MSASQLRCITKPDRRDGRCGSPTVVPRVVSREDQANLALKRGDPPHELLPRAARRTRLVLQRLQLRAQQLLGLLQRLRARTLLPQRRPPAVSAWQGARARAQQGCAAETLLARPSAPSARRSSAASSTSTSWAGAGAARLTAKAPVLPFSPRPGLLRGLWLCVGLAYDAPSL